MAHFKLLLNSLVITIAIAFLTDKDLKNNSCTRININLPKSLEPLIYEIKFYDITPRFMTPNIKKNKCNKTDVHILIEQYNEVQQAKYGFIYTAVSIIDVPIDRQTKTIRLHILNLQINERQTILVYTDENKNSTSHIRPKRHLFNEKEQTIVLDFGDDILSLLDIQMDFVICKLHILFRGDTGNQESGGFFTTSYIDGTKRERHWLTAVDNFQAVAARQVFPCWDDITIKTKFQININHQYMHRALSNVQMENCSYEDSRDDMFWTEFHFTDEIPPYFFKFIVFDFPLHSTKYGTNMWSRYLTAVELDFAWDIVANVTFRSKEMWYNKCNKTDVLNISEKWHEKCDKESKVRISLMKLNHVAIPGFLDEGMESFGLVYYSEFAISYSKTFDTIARKIKVAGIVARKTILSLFGSMIPLSSWSQLWLNEGIATFMGIYIVDQFIPDFRMMDLFVVQNQHDSLRLNFYYNTSLIVETSTISDIKSLFSSILYLKAAVFMRMLQHVMTNESFLLGLNLYLERQFNIVKNDSSDTSKLTFNNFWTAMTTSFETTHVSQFDLKKKFDNWMVQGHYPVVIIKRDYNEKDLNYVTIQLSREVEFYSNKWTIPITYTTKTKLNFTKTSPDYWLEPQMWSLIIPSVNKDDWIIVNIQQAGCYRVNYDSENWQLIADYLRFEDHTRIHVLNRAQIIDDSFHFLLKGQLRFYIFWELTAYLFNETDYVAWYPMFKIFEQMSISKSYNVFPYSSSVRYKRHMLYILHGLLDKIGYEETPFENPLTVSLRQEAAKWACFYGSSTCKETAVKILHKRVSENTLMNILPGWKHWTFCNGLISAKLNEKGVGDKPPFWRQLFDFFSNNYNPNVLEFFTCSKDTYTIKAYMTFLAEKMSYYNENERSRNFYIYSFYSLIAKHIKIYGFIDYFLGNFDEYLSHSETSKIAILKHCINHVHSKNEIDKIINFIKKNNIIMIL